MEKTCAYSKTRANSESSHSDQSDNFDASAMQAIKKRKRAALHSHNKRRRDNKINKRLRSLRNLIPHCTQMDKESVLDEAIVYLKYLQFQLQIMPTFAGLCPISYPTIYLRLGTGPPQFFGLPSAGLSGYGTRLQMPPPVTSPQKP